MALQEAAGPAAGRPRTEAGEAPAEVHDAEALAAARRLVDAMSPKAVQEAVIEAVRRNEQWRGRQCLNLVAAESPTSPTVRALLSAEVGTRASGGHIGERNRCFAAMRHIDEIEALCVELLKRLFACGYADHRLMGGMAACHAVYTALAEPGDIIMSIPPAAGGDSSNRSDGPPGARGLKVVDVPYDHHELEVDLDLFRRTARLVRPRLVGLGLTMALFPFPLREMREVVGEWGGRIYVDAAHQLGLIAGGMHPHPLQDGADIMTGSGGKTFSGPQSGVLAWNDPALTRPVGEAIFPILTGSHQINRVAALAAAAADMLAYGRPYMRQVVQNAKALGAALAAEGMAVLCAHKGYTSTHQIMLDVRAFGGGFEVAQRLATANLVVNKMLLPQDRPEDLHHPGGVRLGTVEVTRLGMREAEMRQIAGFMARVLQGREPPHRIAGEIAEFRRAYQVLYYCHDAGLPPWSA